MARIKGSFQTDSNYELGIRRPLDSRQLVTKIADLTNPATWEKYDNGDGTYYNNAFNGMIVACAEDACIYVLKDRSKLTSLEDGWKKLDSNASIDVDNINITLINGGKANDRN